jgi:serine/threonine protein kinase
MLLFVAPVDIENDPFEELKVLVMNPNLSESIRSQLLKDQIACQALARGTFKARDAVTLVRRLEKYVTSTKQTRFAEIGCFLFDGPLVDVGGQERTVLQYVIRGTTVYCAKIGPNKIIRREIDVLRDIHSRQICPTIIPIVAEVEFDDERLAMIMPFYPLGVHKIESSVLSQRDTIISNIGISGLASIMACENCGICHGDIKPANMMLVNSSTLCSPVVTIDFGSAVEYGRSIPETSSFFPLDMPAEGSLEYDLTCLGTVILQLTGVTISSYRTRRQVLDKFSDSLIFDHRMALYCFSAINTREVAANFLTLIHEHFSDIIDGKDYLLQSDDIFPVLK